MSGVRTFIGIPLPDDVLDVLDAACDAVKSADPAWRDEKWVPRGNVHVTLKFLGDVAEEDLDALGDAVATAASLHARFDLEALGFRVVPNARRTRMLWATFADPDGRCAALAAELDRACLAFGIRPDGRTFKPHATLVRARREHRIAEGAIEAARERVSRAPAAVSVSSVRLYSSRLTNREPIYSVLRECPLGAA